MYLYCHFFFFFYLFHRITAHYAVHIIIIIIIWCCCCCSCCCHHHHHYILKHIFPCCFFFFLGCYSFLQCKYGLISCRLISIIRYEPLFITSCHPYQPIHIVTSLPLLHPFLPPLPPPPRAPPLFLFFLSPHRCLLRF